jgi:peptidoglycan LD-endopeptidase CwlK
MLIEPIQIKRIQALHPLVREDAMKAYSEAVMKTPKGIHPVIIQTLRTFEESDLLYQKGRTRPGPKVTNAKAGQSYHNYGLALDFALQVNGKIIWKVTKDWMTVVDIFKEHGWSWGGDWKGSLKDYPHLEKVPGGLKWRDLLALHNSGKVDQFGYVII